MSTSYNIYVGPYICIFNPLKDSEVEYHTCPKVKCENHKNRISDGFCSKCGSRIVRMTFPCKERTDFDPWEEFNGTLSDVTIDSAPENYLYLIPNMDNDVGLHLDGACFYESHIDLKKSNEDVKKFFVGRSVEIDRLKNVFGETNVDIKWGILVWLS